MVVLCSIMDAMTMRRTVPFHQLTNLSCNAAKYAFQSCHYIIMILYRWLLAKFSVERRQPAEQKLPSSACFAQNLVVLLCFILGRLACRTTLTHFGEKEEWKRWTNEETRVETGVRTEEDP